MFQKIKKAAKALKKETYAVYLATKDRRTPWYAKLLGIIIISYALSPIDLIPDFIPILGYLDDIILVPVGIWLLLKLIPGEVMEECRQRAELELNKKEKNWFVGAIIIVIWISSASLFFWWVYKWWYGV
eukprot:TRINITY_DN6894_c0_g1_i1.p1 TRINITY_DN6894_c0_g1~~TRINITY_DN6894_c0_g1_i1.p1  ORF type:complete len:129 (+),score=9.52 TRINITY_DN6894_c0_g1_i1:135-521(+)